MDDLDSSWSASSEDEKDKPPIPPKPTDAQIKQFREDANRLSLKRPKIAPAYTTMQRTRGEIIQAMERMQSDAESGLRDVNYLRNVPEHHRAEFTGSQEVEQILAAILPIHTATLAGYGPLRIHSDTWILTMLDAGCEWRNEHRSRGTLDIYTFHIPTVAGSSDPNDPNSGYSVHIVTENDCYVTFYFSR